MDATCFSFSSRICLYSFTLHAFALARIRSSSAAFAREMATELVDAHDPNDDTEPVGEFLPGNTFGMLKL